MSLISEKYALTTQTHGVPLVATMKKYTRVSERRDPHRAGVILLLGHGAGFFKETWEPTIEDLLKLDDERVDGPQVREVWALDCQNHGEASSLNEDIFSRNMNLTIWDYADAFATLVRSGLLGPINLSQHQIVLCGHSAGAVGVTLATSFFNPPYRLPFSSLILIDPPIWGNEKRGQETEVYKMVKSMTPIRKDIWKSFEAAKDWLKNRPPWGMWDERVFDIYVKYGLRALPTAYYPERTSGVTLTTHRQAENMAFAGEQFSYEALNRLNQICIHIPVHLIYGENDDMFAKEVQDSIVNPQEGRIFASIVRVEEAGHLVVEEAPTKLALAIFTALNTPPKTRPKL